MSDGINVGYSELFRGKSIRDMTITMWLEDIGQFGFSWRGLQEEFDAALGIGWFAANVLNRVSLDLMHRNRQREQNEYRQTRPLRNPWWKICYLRVVEYPAKLRFRWHYSRHQAKQKLLNE